ncbi:MAG: hypothetical protein QOI34_923 [Verrucomicrobiota bacterium]
MSNVAPAKNDGGRSSGDANPGLAEARPSIDPDGAKKPSDDLNPIRHRAFSLARIGAIAANTLTELTRMKAFYFLMIFALLLIGSSVFMARLSFQQEFQILKDISLGAMSIFTSLLAIIATARLIPQDIEDRTIYTILAKPVPRIEYLVGRLSGVLGLLAISILVMSGLFVIVMYSREQSVFHETARQMSAAPPDALKGALQAVRDSAFNLNIIPGIAVIYLKSCLLAALTLFVSTFATTQIFTMVVMVFIYFIGHLQAMAREYWLHEHATGFLTKFFLAFVALVFPDLQAFNLIDDIVVGSAIPMALFLKTAGLGMFYIVIYTVLAAIVFQGKEL